MADHTETADETAQIEADTNTPLNAWEMARSILRGIEQTLEQARKEFHEKQAATPDKPHTARAEQMLVEAVMDAKATLEPDLRQIARANGRSL